MPQDRYIPPFIRGPRKTQPQMQERLRNYTRVAHAQQEKLIAAAAAILRRGEPLTHDAIRKADASLQLMDVMPQKLIDAANAVRQRPHVPDARLADELALLGGIAPEIVGRLRYERTERLLRPLGYEPIAVDGGLQGWRRRLPNQTEILITAANGQANAAPEAPVWTAGLFDEDSNSIAESDKPASLPDLLARLQLRRIAPALSSATKGA